MAGAEIGISTKKPKIKNKFFLGEEREIVSEKDPIRLGISEPPAGS